MVQLAITIVLTESWYITYNTGQKYSIPEKETYLPWVIECWDPEISPQLNWEHDGLDTADNFVSSSDAGKSRSGPVRNSNKEYGLYYSC